MTFIDVLLSPPLSMVMLIMSTCGLIFSAMLKKNWYMKVRQLTMLIPRGFLVITFFSIPFIGSAFPILIRMGLLSMFTVEAVYGLIDLHDWLRSRKKVNNAS